MNTPSRTARGQQRRPFAIQRPALLVAAALAAASLGAVAQTAAPLTRAEVVAELERARASGELERSLPESFHMVWLYQDAPRAALAGRDEADDQAAAAAAARKQARAEAGAVRPLR